MSQSFETDIDLSVCSKEDIEDWFKSINTTLESINCSHVGLDDISSILIISQKDVDVYLISLEAVAAENESMTNFDAVQDYEPKCAPACTFTFKDCPEIKPLSLNCSQIFEKIFESTDSDYIKICGLEISTKNSLQFCYMDSIRMITRIYQRRRTLKKIAFISCKLINQDFCLASFLCEDNLSVRIGSCEFRACKVELNCKDFVAKESVFQTSSLSFSVGSNVNQLNIDRCNFSDTKLGFSESLDISLQKKFEKFVDSAMIESFQMTYSQLSSPPEFADDIYINEIPDIRGTVIDKPIDFENLNFKHKHTQPPKLSVPLKKLSINLLKALAVVICFYPFVPLVLLLSFIIMFCYLLYLTSHPKQCIQTLKNLILNRFQSEAGKAAKFHALAEHARAHHLKDDYLLFHAQELRAKRWSHIDGHGFLRSLVNWWMDFLSDYGRSVIRPCFALLLCFVSFAFLYTVETENTCNNQNEISWFSSCWGQAFEYSLNNSFPFLNLDKRVNEEVEALTATHQQASKNNQLMTLTAGMQKLISLLFLFLIGLGLRNTFRL